MRHNGSSNPREIQHDIERTRSEMESTLTAIEQRLTPGQLFDQGMDYLRHSGGAEFVSNLGEQAKNNPMPVALVGIGLAWLMASSKQPQSPGSMNTSQIRERTSGAVQSAQQQIERARGGIESMLREQPLALGAIGLAVGAMLAAAAPRTRQEDELMGEARDRLAEKAAAAGKEQVDKAER